MNRLLAALPLTLLVGAGSSLPITPGKWQSTVVVTDMQMPGGSPEISAAMRAHPTTVTACVTPQQAADGPRAVLQGSGGKCHYTRFTAAGGRLNAELQCAFTSSTMTTVSSGSYTATTMDIVGSATMQTRRGLSTTKTHVTGKRVGAC